MTFSLCSLVDSQAAYVDAIAKVFKHAQCIGALPSPFLALLLTTAKLTYVRRPQTNTSPRSFKAPAHRTTIARTTSSIATCACTSSATCADAATSLVTLCAVSCCRMSASCSTSVGARQGSGFHSCTPALTMCWLLQVSSGAELGFPQIRPFVNNVLHYHHYGPLQHPPCRLGWRLRSF